MFSHCSVFVVVSFALIYPELNLLIFYETIKIERDTRDFLTKRNPAFSSHSSRMLQISRKLSMDSLNYAVYTIHCITLITALNKTIIPIASPVATSELTFYAIAFIKNKPFHMISFPASRNHIYTVGMHLGSLAD